MRPFAPPINLLHEEKKSFLDVFVAWALTIGRFLLILTESLALAVFAYRFTLDRQLVDLHDQIKQQSIYVGLLSDREKTFRDIQKRITAVDKITAPLPNQTQQISEILNQTNKAMTITQFSYLPTGIHFEGKAFSLSGLKQFVTFLQANPLVSSVSIDKIENKTSTAVLSVSITASFKSATPAKGGVK
jgi:hypothetical protein